MSRARAAVRQVVFAVLPVVVSLAVVVSGLSQAPAHAARSVTATARAAARARRRVAVDVTQRPDSVSAMIAARVSGHRVEDLSQRDEFNRVYANPDGTWTAATASEPEQVQDPGGVWHDIDTDLVAKGGGWAPAWAASDVVFSGGGGSTFASLTEDGKKLDWRWPGSLPKPVVTGSTATYQEAAPGEDLVLTATATGFTQDIVLKQRPAGPVHLELPVGTHGAALRPGVGGSLDIVTAHGKQLEAAPAPVMWDSSTDAGGQPRVAPVGTSIGQDSAGTPTLTLSPDEGFLDDPATVYPVTVDPSFTAYTSGDAWVENPGYTSGQVSSPELRVGTYDGGGHVARAFLHFDGANSKWAGKDILSAKLVLRNYYSGSCTGAVIRASRIASAWDATTLTWGNQPNGNSMYTADYKPAHGYDSSCAAGNATWDVTAMAQPWANWAANHNTGYANNGIKLKAPDETSSFTWRRYRSANYDTQSLRPHLNVTYNSFPATPTAPTFTPVASYTPPGGSASNYTSDATPKTSTTVSDPDGGTVRAVIDFYTSKTGSPVASCTTGYVASGSTASCSPSTALSNTTYYVQAQAYDGTDYSKNTSAWSQVTVATGTPAKPSIDCGSYADGSWTDTPPASNVSCVISATGSGTSAPGKISYSIDGGATKTVAITQSTDPAVAKTTVYVPNSNGGHSVAATAISPAGTSSASQAIHFGYGTLSLDAPATSPLATTTGNLAITASGPPAVSGTPTAVLKWRLAGSGAGDNTGWTTGPGLKVTSDTTGVHVSGTWDTTTATHDDATNTDLDPRTPNLLEVEVCVDYAAGTQCSWGNDPTQVLRLAHAFGDGFPVRDVPGGQVALWTGEFATSATDASLQAGDTTLSVSRQAATFDGGSANPADTVFGKGWTASLDGPEAGYAGAQVIDATRTQGVIEVLDGYGDTMVFAPAGKPARRTGSAFTTGPWLPLDSPTQQAGVTGTIAGTGAGTTFTLTDPDGTTTTFTVTAAPTASTDATFTATGVQQPGDPSATSYSYDGQGRVTRILAPVPAGVTCPATGPLPAGCRALAITYAATTTATSTTPGDYAGQASKITTLVGTGTGTNASTNSTIVATYAYDTTGRLASVTDPRTNLTTSYGYDGTTARIASITPPGQTEVDYTYNASQQLDQVTRTRPSGDSPAGTADLATIVYGVPTGGTAATGVGLPDLSDAAVAAWAQPAGPTYAAAIFGADHPLPAGTTAADLGASDSPYASVSYTNDEGYETNTADYGAGRWLLSDTEYDAAGNAVRELSTSDIAAIQDGTLAPDDAGTLTVYNTTQTGSSGNVTLPADTEVTDTYQTARYAMVPDAATGDPTATPVRPHTHIAYDQGAPNGDLNPATGQAYALPTTVTQGAADPSSIDTSAGASEPADLQVLSTVKTGYANAVPGGAADAGWNLDLPSTSTVVNGSQDITSTTTYNKLGQVTSTSQPDSNGADPGTRDSAYYTGDATSQVASCDNHPEWQGLLCQTHFAGDPATGPAMITTDYTYNDLQETTQTVETSGPVTRTNTTGYDTAGRQTSTGTTVTGLSGSTPVPDLTYGYDPATGLPTTTTPAGGAAGGPISTAYDSWGRTKTYTTSTGQTSTSYDAAGNIATVATPDGTTTSYTYDGTDTANNTEHRGLVTGITATNNAATETITAAYDADGNLVRQNLGGGVTQLTSYDTGGDLTGRVYTGDVTSTDSSGVSTTSVDQDWIGWTQEFDALGRVTTDWTPDGAALSGDTTGTAATGYARAYSYDAADRLTKVIDQTATSPGAGPVNSDGTTTDGSLISSCVIRQYGFDGDGNRTSLTTIPAAADGTCQSGTSPVGAVTKAWTYDHADRITNAGYGYDNLGRVTSLPEADTPQGVAAAATGTTGPGDLAIGYYDTDTVHTLTQNGTTTSYGLDAMGRPLTQATGPTAGTATSSTALGYADETDSPAWETTTTGSTTSTETYLTGPDGNLAATLTSTGAVQPAVNNPHGDSVSQITLPATGDAAGLDDWTDTDEYGNPLNPTSVGTTATNPGGTSATDTTGGLGYGWTGAKQRATSGTGLLLMGARLYNPVTGQFTSLDPVIGGNTTPYTYPQDPINGYDTTGEVDLQDNPGGAPVDGPGGASRGGAADGYRLNRHLSQLQRYGAAGTRQLESGRIRYYGHIEPARKPGDIMGRRVVREWDPRTDRTRTWHENLDHSGRVRIVRPQQAGRHVHYQFNEYGMYAGRF